MKHTFSLILLAFLVCNMNAQTPAFPGAEGHGRYTTGGRGGTVYYVNTLDDTNSGSEINNEGSFRWCLERTGKRTILFKVSGTIHLIEELGIKNGDVTIAGQSAPGDGICVADYPVTVLADNVIIRYMRFRMGDLHLTRSDGADGLGARRNKNIIIDHCSISWSTDECGSFYENENFTLQWCMVTESLRLSGHSKGAHGYGAIWGGFGASFHHNLLAHHDSRAPRLGPGAFSTKTNELADVRNNVFYNYNGNGCYGGEGMHVNLVNNYYKPGPAFDGTYARRGRIVSISKNTNNPEWGIYNTWGTFYIDGNYIDGHKEATSNNWTYGVYNQFHSSQGIVSDEVKKSLRLSKPLETGVVTTHSPQEAYIQVLLYAGASLKRDELDSRIIEETKTNTAKYKGLSDKNSGAYPRLGIIDSQQDIMPVGASSDWIAWPILQQAEVLPDSNKDGVPDGWLEMNYSNNKATDLNEEGYTYLEVYLNSLVEEITRKQNENAITNII